jgi:hypothetical protein
MSAAIVAIASWIGGLCGLKAPPAEVIASVVVLITPAISVGLKKLGIASN